MSEEQRRVLQMLQDGIITPDEAERLLTALDSAPPPANQMPVAESIPAGVTILAPGEGDSSAPDMRQFRRHWEVPFAAGIILLGVSGLCITGSGGLIAFCGWMAFFAAAAVTMIGFWSKTSPWVHIRIHETDGGRFAISIPLPPFGVLESGLRFAKRFVDRQTDQNLDTAISMLSMMKDRPPDEPISVDINDEDGDHVQVYIG